MAKLINQVADDMDEFCGSLVDLLKEDVSGIDTVEDNDTPAIKFNYKYSYAFLGFTALTILKGDKEVIPYILALAPNSNLHLFISEMNAFLEHITNKSIDIDADSNYTVTQREMVNEICNTFQENLGYFKKHYKDFIISKNYLRQQEITEDLDKYITDPSKFNSLFNTLTIYRNPKNPISIDMLDSTLNYLVSFRNKQVILTNLQTLYKIYKSNNLTPTHPRLFKMLNDDFIEITDMGKSSSSSKEQLITLFIKLLKFKDKSYYYTDDEVYALKALDFPTQCIGNENILYDDYMVALNSYTMNTSINADYLSYPKFFALYNKHLQMRIAGHNNELEFAMYF